MDPGRKNSVFITQLHNVNVTVNQKLNKVFNHKVWYLCFVNGLKNIKLLTGTIDCI